jgi:hypothetical protein
VDAAEFWKPYDAVRMAAFARAWLHELRNPPADAESAKAGEAVVMMNFTAPPEKQWLFIDAAVALAESDDELGDVAAGPVEHLLGWHGDTCIDHVEGRAATDPKFARMLTGVMKYRIADAVWKRVRLIQEKVSSPLRLKPNDSAE